MITAATYVQTSTKFRLTSRSYTEKIEEKEALYKIVDLSERVREIQQIDDTATFTTTSDK